MFVDDAIISIVLIEDYACENKNQLKARELHFITTLECININKPFISDIQIINGDNKEWHKQYHETNKEQITQYQAQYKETNKEEIKQQRALYNEINKEQIAEKNKQYRETHKEEIAQQKAQYYQLQKLKQSS